jgi:hypothetical protein
MSLFSWLFPAGKPAKSAPESSGLSRMEATRPVQRRNGGSHGRDSAPQHPQGNAQPANRKGERMARRELLYGVVRESMIRAGVLSSNYKFKVLSLDARGRQFLVMVDLARDSGGDTARLAEIEVLIAQAAKSRHDIIVTAVYWRTNEHVAVGDPRAHSANSAPMPLDSQPAVLESNPMPLHAQRAAPMPVTPQRTPSRFEPIQADEVAAFKQALAASVAPQGERAVPSAAAAAAAAAHGAVATAFDGSAKHGPQSYTLLTGFEDTEMPESGSTGPALSGTQYGDLR